MAAVPQTERATTASLAELRNPVQPREVQLPAVRAGFSDLAGFELAQRAAKALAASTLVPKEYQGNIPNCLIALELAQRIGASPMMVMQNLDIVHGRPTWRAQFVIACINQCGRYTALQYEWTGERGKDNWTCRAFAKDKATGERVQGPSVSIDMAKKEGWYSKNGSKWQTIPELMLMYRSGAWFGRTNAPELTMGLMTSDEAHDIIDVEGVTVEQLREPGGAEPTPAQPAAEGSKEPGFKLGELTLDAVLADIEKAKDADIASLVLDAARSLPDEKYELAANAYKAKWGAK